MKTIKWFVAVVLLGSFAMMGYARFSLLNTSCYGKCIGSKTCSACKNCTGCAHCAKGGGTCGVCK